MGSVAWLERESSEAFYELARLNERAFIFSGIPLMKRDFLFSEKIK